MVNISLGDGDNTSQTETTKLMLPGRLLRNFAQRIFFKSLLALK